MRYRCAINGQELDEVDERIYITDIKETAPKMRTESVLNAIYSGTRITRRARQSLTVKILFSIRERDVYQRQEIMGKIYDWAKSGKLMLSTRPGQYLQVIPDTLPYTDSALRWWDTLTMDFAAYAFPYWRDQIPINVGLTGTTASKTVFVPGNAWEEEDIFVEAEVTNKGNAALNALELTAGNTRFRFASLNLPPGKVLSITYGDDGILRIIITNEPIFLDSTGRDILRETRAQNGYLAVLAEGRRAEIYSSMEQIASIVRGSDLETIKRLFPIGDQIIVPWKDMDDAAHNTNETAYPVEWDIVHHGMVTLQDGSVVPGMYLMMHKCSAYGVQFSHQQAFLNCPDGLTAGTYHLTLSTKWGTHAVAGTTWQFTLTQDVPAGGRLSGFEGMIQTPAAVDQYANVNASKSVRVPCGCCLTVSVRNNGTTPVNVQNAKLTIE